MWVSRLNLTNVRGFSQKHSISFAKNINIFVGQNNSGKSTILASILSLQRPSLNYFDITFGSSTGTFTITVREPGSYLKGIDENTILSGLDSIQFTMSSSGAQSASTFNSAQNQPIGNFTEIPNTEPNNAFYPYLSKRKVASYIEEIRENHVRSVSGTLDALYNKIDRLSDRFFRPSHDEYVEACEKIIGFPISTTQSVNGKRAVYTIKNMDNIPLTAMGEGVSNLLGLIVDLCVAEGKIFVIEELENDVHPKQLKALLELIERKAENNQFFISTHSNIVTKQLGSVDEAKVFRVMMTFDETTKLPTSTVSEVENETAARLRLLEELGYEPYDFGQWSTWLILEESSAEVLIREFLIPSFVPKLKNKLRTYSASSLSEVEPKFRDFNNLFVFIHLEQVYKNRAWVVVDAGEREGKIVSQLRETYSKSGWKPENFAQFSQHDFELYFPTRFKERVDQVLAIGNKGEKRRQKQLLLDEVKHWILDKPEEARLEFAKSAKEVIDLLKKIAKSTN